MASSLGSYDLEPLRTTNAPFATVMFEPGTDTGMLERLSCKVTVRSAVSESPCRSVTVRRNSKSTVP